MLDDRTPPSSTRLPLRCALVLALLATGCAPSTHEAPPAPDAGDPPDAASGPDAGAPATDAGRWTDASDAGIPDAATDPEVPDAGDTDAAADRGVFYVVRRDTDLCLDVTGLGTADGTNVEQWTCNGGANQMFRLEHVAGTAEDAVRLVDESSGKCVTVAGPGAADGSNLQIGTCDGGDAQRFTVDDLGGGESRLRYDDGDLCLAIDQESSADGANAQLWTCNGSPSQTWQLRSAIGDAGDPPGPMTVHQAGPIVTMSTGKVRIDYDLGTGTADFWYDGARRISGFYAGVQLESYVTSRDYETRTFTHSANQGIVTSEGPGLPKMQQVFNLDGGHRFLARLVVLGEGLHTRWIAPIVVSTPGVVDIGSRGDVRALRVPFDNDAWVTYDAGPINTTGTSYEAAAFYDNVTRNGLVVGSVLHDTWKTGVYFSGSNDRLDALNVFGGTKWTPDALDHGEVSGDVLYSPMIFVGYGPDWRDLMEELADVNAAYVEKLAWSGGVPFGWNSWGKVQTNLSFDVAVGVSDFMHGALQSADFQDQGTVYITLDSYWDNLSDDELAQFVAHCHQNGQKAGIYWAPFVDWGKWSRPVEGSTHTYDEIWLRDGDGNPIELDGAYAVDPTHPATQQRIDTYIDRFESLGFEAIKLDFLTHGALESSVRYDAAVQTGIAAYNVGMRYVRDRIAGAMFISESIAPLFPHGYAHARRVSCDTYGAATGFASSQYELNSASYGFWLSGRLYEYNDPDSMVFEGFSAAANMTRLLSGVVSGTLFISGDDLTSATGQQLATTYLTNPRINDVARLGRAFRPVEGNTGTGPSEVMVLRDGARTYLAIFNFSGAAVTRTLGLARAGLEPRRLYSVTDLWSGETSTAQGTLTVSLEQDGAKLFQLE